MTRRGILTRGSKGHGRGHWSHPGSNRREAITSCVWWASPLLHSLLLSDTKVAVRPPSFRILTFDLGGRGVRHLRIACETHRTEGRGGGGAERENDCFVMRHCPRNSFSVHESLTQRVDHNERFDGLGRGLELNLSQGFALGIFLTLPPLL